MRAFFILVIWADFFVKFQGASGLSLRERYAVVEIRLGTSSGSFELRRNLRYQWFKQVLVKIAGRKEEVSLMIVRPC